MSKKGSKKTMGDESTNKFLAILLTLIILFSAYFYVRVENNEKTLRNKDFKSNSEPTPTILQPTPTLTPTPKPRKLDGGKLFNLVNDYRKKNGLSELLWYHPLCEFAKARSQQVKDDWSHEGYLKEATRGALYTSICPECGSTGENLAEGYYSEEAALQGWINSSSHKQNLDANWDWGCAMYYSNNYVSILFGKKK